MLSYLKILYLVIIIQIFLAQGVSSLKQQRRRTLRPRKYQNRIVGGIPVDIAKIPYQVAILDHGDNHCGGSIISIMWIISAAHCGLEKNKNHLTVRAGSSYWASGGKIYRVQKIILHENYVGHENDFDYMLLEVKQPLTYNNHEGIIALPGANQEIYAGVECTVSGWGLTQNDKEDNSKVRAVAVPIIENTECANKYASLMIAITDHMICAGYPEGERDACTGDSGGPLVCNGILYGLVSFGFECATANAPGVYSKVSAVREWIQQITGV